VHSTSPTNISVDLIPSKGENPGLDLRALDVKGKNHRLFIPRLGGKAVSVTAVQRTDRLVVTIKKGDTAHWSSLKSTEVFSCVLH